MAADIQADDEMPSEGGTHRHRGRSIAKWSGIVLGGLLLLLGLVVIGLNTSPGHRLVADQINKMEMASGLRIGVGRLEGSLFGKLRIRQLTLSDTRGVFFSAPEVQLDWRPFAYLKNRVDIRSAVIPTAHLRRLPALKPSGDPDAPLLPDLNIDIGQFSLQRLRIDPAVTGQRHLMSLAGSAHIADRRAQITADARTIAGAGLAGGDRLVLRLDAVPERNRLDLQARLDAPRGGLVAGMAGLEAPLAASVNGRGDWRNWVGRAQSTLGGRPLANLSVTARNGTFALTGPIHPGLILKGPVERLAAPFVQFNLVTTLQERRADTRLNLRSTAFAAAAQGILDLGENRFQNFKLAARLLQPGAIAPNLRGRDVQAALLLNGAFASPVVAYEVNAAALGFGETVVERLHAQGRARVDADRIVVPISARAARVSGLNPAVGGLLTNVAIDGSLAISGSHILSDNLRIRSDKLNATAIVVADVAKGEYRGGIQGTINNYEIKGIGLLDITTNMDVETRGDGFGISGRVVVRTRRLDNASVRDFLGGNATISANIGMEPSGLFTLSRIRVSSPQLQISDGSGRYAPNGQIAFQASGLSKAYGRFSVAVTGTATQPVIRVRAAQPGFGIGLSNVNALIRATGRGYAITATGQSQYGPFKADLTILTGGGPMTVDIRSLVLAGINVSGRVVQTAAGPFAGTLSLSGQGLEGTVRLAAAGRYQRADVSARANGARVPGEVPILIQRGILQATAILYPDAPSIVADAQLAGVRSGDLLVQTARARVNYRGGRGNAQLVAEGRSGVPYRIAVNSALTPTHIRAAMSGTVNRLSFRLARPADIRKMAGGWRLAPATIVLPQGNVRVAGQYGNGLVVQSRFENLDLSILNAFSPALGVGGRATGSLDFAQPGGASFPRAEARLTVDSFTRTGLATRSVPVSLAMVGRLEPSGGSSSVVIRRGTAVIGRAQIRLQPIASAGGWTERLLASPLAGGIRYNGPADVLWSLTGMSGHQLSGPIGVAADFSGRVQSPQLVGVIRANALAYQNEVYGTRITNLALQGRFTSSTLEINQFSGRAGRGTISGQGSVGLAAAAGFPININMSLDRAQLARSDAMGATVSGTLAITNSRAQGALIKGDLQLPEVRYQIVRQGSAEIAELEGVRRRGEPLPRPDEINQQAAGAPSIWKLDLRVRADNQVYISGMGLESEWETDLRVGGTSSSPMVTGTAEVIRGTFSFGGRRFELDDGEITFTGSQPMAPRINLSASTSVEGITATINVGGDATNPRITLTSSPSLPQDEILARLFFGNSVTELSAMQAIQLAASLNSLRGGGGGGLNPLGKLRSAGGFDRLRILGADKNTGRGTALAAGMNISNDIYIEVITDARGFTATQLEVALSKSLSVLSQAGAFNGSSVNFRYSKDY